MKVSAINLNTIFKPVNSNLSRKTTVPFRSKISPVLISSVAASTIMAAAMIKQPNKEVTVGEIKQKFIDKGYKNYINNFLSIEPSADQKIQLQRQHKQYYDEYKSILYNKCMPAEQINKFGYFLNIDKNNSRNLFENKFDKSFITFSTLDLNSNLEFIKSLCEQDKNNFKLIENVINNDIDDNTLSELLSYKSCGYLYTNRNLRRKAKEMFYKIPDSEQKIIDTLSKYIDTQPLPETLKLYRGEGYDVLEKVKLQNGENANLAKMMKDAVNSGDDKEIQKIKEFILDNEITATEHGFMSTSIDPNISHSVIVDSHTRDGGIFWEFTLDKNTKGVYIEALNITNRYAGEKEVIMQKESKIKIQDADYNKDDKQWHIKAKISN